MSRRFLPLIGLLLLTGCGQSLGAGAVAVPAPRPTPSPTATATPTDERSAASEADEQLLSPEPECGEEGGLQATVFFLDAALGSRYLSAAFLNCGDSPVDLSGASFDGVLGSGERVDVSYSEESPAPVLAPGRRSDLTLHWLNNGRCERGVQQLFVRVGGGEFDLTQDCLSLGGEYAPERDKTLRIGWGPVQEA